MADAAFNFAALDPALGDGFAFLGESASPIPGSGKAARTASVKSSGRRLIPLPAPAQS
jgi:hypothetical protein